MPEDKIPDIKIRTGITFAEHDKIALAGDLYLPKGHGPFPVLVSVPGGGWRQSQRAGHRQWGLHFARRGYAVFAIDYRVATAERKAFPEALFDCVAAVQFVRGTASELGIDATRVGLFGTSAGAHLASLVALANDYPTFQRPYPKSPYASVNSDVKVLVAIYGIYDMFTSWQEQLASNPGKDGNLTENFLGTSPFDNQQVYFDASPIRHVTLAKNRLPILLAWGTADDAVNPHLQSETFLAALKQAHFNVRPFAVAGAAHFWANLDSVEDPLSYSGYLAPRILRFLGQFL